MAKKRILRSQQEIRELIEQSGLHYIMVNNRIFEQFYQNGEANYTPLPVHKRARDEAEYFKINDKHTLEKVDYSDSKTQYKVNFNERDMIIFILLTFLDQIDFQGYPIEIAHYLGTNSDKRIKERINKLRVIQGEVNNYRGSGKREYLPEPRPIRFISEKKVKGFEGSKQVTLNRWYVNYECDYKQETDKDGNLIDKPENFFMVTIYDLDLLTKGVLNEKEFITYLYLIKSYNSGKDDAIYQSISTISEKINIKDISITEKILQRLLSLRIKDKFCSDPLTDYPLVHTEKPKNYNDNLTKRLEPSLKYYPIYNRTTLQKIKGEEVIQYPTAEELAEGIDEKYMDSDQTNLDTNLLVDSDFAKTDADLIF